MITVFTPTYNRGKLLPRLFKSLQEQTDHDFEWIIIDDGSTDNTRMICQGFLHKKLFPITYVVQKNSGKHVAINRAARIARGEWFFIVDSDDYLPTNSIELNEKYLNQIKNDPAFAGVSGLCCNPDGNLLLFPGMKSTDLKPITRRALAMEYIDATSEEYRDRFKMPGDRAEIVRTELVRRYPFPSFPHENFVSEYYLWQSISNAGLKLRWFNQPTYIAEYRADGLTRNAKAVQRANPLGRCFIDNFAMESRTSLHTKLRAAINYTRYGRFGKKTIKQLHKEASQKGLFFLGLGPALLFPIKREQK